MKNQNKKIENLKWQVNQCQDHASNALTEAENNFLDWQDKAYKLELAYEARIRHLEELNEALMAGWKNTKAEHKNCDVTKRQEEELKKLLDK